MIIRNATIIDAPMITTIHIDAWRTAYKGIMPDAYLDELSIESKTKQWTKALSSDDLGINLVIEHDGIIVGFCVFAPARDTDLKGQSAGELVALNIIPKYWNKGFGSMLIESVIKESKKQKWQSLYLWVLQKNVRAKKFYQSKGFVTDATEKLDDKLTGHKLHEVRYTLKIT